MASYRADIEIAVKGAQELKRLQDQISATAKMVDTLNTYIQDIGSGGIGRGVVRSIENLTTTVNQAATAFNSAALGTQEATIAARRYVTANNALNASLKERAALLEQINLEGQSSPVTLSSPLRGRTESILKQRKGAKELAEVLADLEEQDRLLSNSKLDAKALAIQTALDAEAAAAEQTAAQIKKLSDRQQEFTTRTNAAAQAAAGQTAEFYRQKRIALQVARLNETAPKAQLLLNPAAPGSPAMSGGARRQITGPVERAGGMRTQDEAATTLRWAQATKQLIQPLSQADAIIRGIAIEAARVPPLLGLPSSQMLNASVRGIRQIETAEDKLNTERAESVARLRELDRLEESRARRAKKLQGIGDYNKPATELQPAKGGGKGFLDQLSNPSSKLGSAVIGGGFPALMGGGPGTILGGALGGAAGGFAGSIAASAIGQVFDDFAAAATEAGKSLTYPIEGFEKLKEASLFASREQEYYISKLIETGRVAEATAVIQAEMIKKVGVRGVNDLAALGESSIELSKVWAEFNLQLQAALAGPMTGLLKWLTGIVGLVSTINAEKTTAEEVRAGLSSKDRAKFDKEIAKIRNAYGDVPGKAITFEEARKRKAQVVQEFKPLSKPIAARGALTPEDREKAIKAAEQQADTIKDAYRTGFRLQQQGIDLQRQGSDLQRRVAQDIYNKQQEILRLQVDNDRQRKQVAIEMVDLEYRRRISNEEGRVAAVLEAEAALMKTKAEGEANIEAKKRLLELDIDKQKRETENYIFELGRTIDGIRRSTLSLEMDVADYRLKIERQIGEQRRIEETGQAAGVVQTTGGRSGVTANSVAGFPITSRQGMRTHPVTGGQKMHAGTDIGTPMNTALAYSMGGVVTKATTMGGYGKILEVKLDNGVTAFAAHLNETLVKAGDKFTARQLLARTGQTGVGTGPHLHMEGNRGGDSTAPLPYLVLNGKASKVAAAAKSSTATQLTEASGKITPRPVVTPNVTGVQAGMGEYNEKNAALRKQALSIEQQLQNLREQAALDNLAAVARGSKEIQQRKDALAYAKAELGTIGAGNQDLQERLALEAQSGVKVKIYQDANDDILAKTKLQGEERKKLELALAKGLEYTKQQITLDKEALDVAQQTRFEKEKAAIQAQLGITGKGLQAGFIGQAGQAYESEMLKSGNVQNAEALAAQTQALELATTKARALEGAYNDIGSAMASTLTDGVAGLVAGTTTAEQVFSDFLKNIGQALMKAAQQMIAQYLAIAAAKAIAGLLGGGSSGITGGSTYGGAAFGSGFNPGTSTAFGGMSIPGFAEGGNPPVGRPSLVGEQGPELFVPRTAGTIVPADATAAAMARYQRQGSGSGAGGSSSDAMAAGEATPVLSMSFETTRFLGQDYVSTEQLQAAMAATERRATTAGAKAGAAQVSSQMRNSPGYRRQVGLR